ncbi:MAG: hypothetical protein WC254_03905, partial [Candidatus Woesearchaeota archaeon]
MILRILNRIKKKVQSGPKGYNIPNKEIDLILTRIGRKIKKTVTKKAPTTLENIQWYHEYNKSPKLIFVDPQKIKYFCKRDKLPAIKLGEIKVLSGDWDKNNPLFEESLFYISWKQYLKTGNWHETLYYKNVLKELNNWQNRNLRYKTKAEFHQYLNQLEEVYYDMKQEGYKIINNKNQIYVNIAADGSLLLHDGKHRLTFAKFLGIKKIPVGVSFIHKKQTQIITSNDKEIIQKVLTMMQYTKKSNASYKAKEFESGYHSIKLKNAYFRGQRENNVRLQNVSYNFKDKVVLDLGCNVG